MLTIHLFTLLLYTHLTSSINWQGDWALDCDFPGQDLTNQQTPGDQCSSTCATTPGCTHFSWNPYLGGTCWLKTGPAAKSTAIDLPGTVCGIVQGSAIEWQGDWAMDCDFPGRDLVSKEVPGEQCGAVCAGTEGCTHFAWRDGVCWMKSGAVEKWEAVRASGVVCGVVSVVVSPSKCACAKRGLAYDFESDEDVGAVSEKLSWWYNWNYKYSQNNHGMEFVPMAWGKDIPPYLPSGSKYLLGFNEPNFFAQSNLSPTNAASLWSGLTQRAKSMSAKVVSPAVNYCGGGCHETDPVVYLDKFFAACTDCQIDYIAVHSYVCTATALKNYLSRFHKYNKKIWLTELACGPWDNAQIANSPQAQMNFMKEAVRVLENDPWVFRYAWFSGRNGEIPAANVFASSPGKLSDLGAQYMSQPCAPVISSVLEENEGIEASPVEPANNGLVIGLAVGIPGVVLLSVLGVVFIYRSTKKNENANEKVLNESLL